MCLALFIGLSLTQNSYSEEVAPQSVCPNYYNAADVKPLAKRAWSRIDGPKKSQLKSYRHRKFCHGPGKKNKIIHTWKSAKKKYEFKGIDGLSNSYEKFVILVHKKTDLSLRVLGAWVLAEGGPSYNPLNIGPGHYFDGIKGGAKATVSLLKSSYSGIMSTANKSDSKQIGAIVASSWCPGCAGYSSLLWGTYNQVRIK